MSRTMIELGPEGWIEKNPQVCGGVACIAGHRIPVWGLEVCRRSGLSIQEVLAAYPQLGEADIAAAWLYADFHKDEINQDIKGNQ